MELQNICENCFESFLPECIKDFGIGGFLPNQPLILYVESFHGKKNARDLTADANGVITLPYNQFGEGFFSEENSPYIFTFKPNVGYCGNLIFTQCVDEMPKEFTCLSLSFFKSEQPELYTNQINCQC
jgi:hypothetical protein